MGGCCFYFYFLTTLILNPGLAWLKFKTIWSLSHKCVICFLALKGIWPEDPYHPGFVMPWSLGLLKEVFWGSTKKWLTSVMIWGTVDLKCSSGFSLRLLFHLKQKKTGSIYFYHAVLFFIPVFAVFLPSQQTPFHVYFPSSNHKSVHLFGNLGISLLRVRLFCEQKPETPAEFGKDSPHLSQCISLPSQEYYFYAVFPWK